MAQTTVTLSQPKGYEGMLASTNLHSIRGAVNEYRNGLVTDVNNNTRGILPFGRAVVADTTDTSKVLLPNLGSTKFLGVSYATSQLEQAMLLTNTDPSQLVGYPPNALVGVMTMGDIFVYSEVNVKSGDPVFVRLQNAGGGVLTGRFSNVGASDFLAYPGATWRTDVAANSLGILTIGTA